MNRRGVLRQNVDHMVGNSEGSAQIIRCHRGNAFVALWISAHGNHLHLERGEQLQKPRRNGPKSQDDGTLVPQNGRFFPELRPAR